MARVTKNQGGKSRQGNRAKPQGQGAVLGYRFPELVTPPAGTFDPGLEAQARASQRGLLDLIEQSHLEGHRQHVDVGQKRRELRRDLRYGREDIGRNRSYAEADAGYQRGQLQTNFARDIEDLSIAKQRGEDAYQRTLVDLQHRYSLAAQNQQSAAIQSGTSESGSATASDAVRAANQGHDTAEVNRQHTEGLEDLARREGRLQQDYGTSMGRLGEGLSRRLTDYGIQGQRLGQSTRTAAHALSLAAHRANVDRLTKLSHAKREQGIYQTDVTQQAYYQAHQYNPSLIYPKPAATFGVGGGGANTPRPYPHVPRAPRGPRIGVGGGIISPQRRRGSAY